MSVIQAAQTISNAMLGWRTEATEWRRLVQRESKAWREALTDSRQSELQQLEPNTLFLMGHTRHCAAKMTCGNNCCCDMQDSSIHE